MAVLKCWAGQQWEQVGGTVLGSGRHVPLSGGRISGDLRVDTGLPMDTQVRVHGSMLSGGIVAAPGGTFDGNIVLTASRVFDLGGARAEHVSDGKGAAGSAATKGYVDRFAVGKPQSVLLPLSTGWTVYGGGWTRPGYRIDSSGGLVSLQGLAKTAGVVVPGGASCVIGVLPTGFRPVQRTRFAVLAGQGGGSLAVLDVLTDGQIRVAQGARMDVDNWLSLDGCQFAAARR